MDKSEKDMVSTVRLSFRFVAVKILRQVGRYG